jgi:hypothetical protein
MNMDLLIKITDENNDVLYERQLYQDGSDSYAIESIELVLNALYPPTEEKP